jgi:hypothetical protein
MLSGQSFNIGEKMKHVEIWFGNMLHGQFSIYSDSDNMVIINTIDEKCIMNPLDVDEYLFSQGYDSYIIPTEFKGLIVFSQDFLKDLSK